ncbi:uncharacterized protein M421DRAFT_100502 [Didymella exigua CBS 183.55]|uniref:Uncharacterized protein n=1 Tax=Didymella exigua CBS 183.55 TaxID=1150837 RepID=A0A6A5RQU6_9PLEO|nr:uncharacterized protein M421DRAFT_100502 [Didymella exigua CBS 183.55]KAF1929404.1 hypothetical protein M421DRAFT_100502 [Didymella exigua CBS 183.55]
MLRRLSRQLNDERDGIRLERKRSKRERISQFFRSKSIRKQKPQQHDEAPASSFEPPGNDLDAPEAAPINEAVKPPNAPKLNAFAEPAAETSSRSRSTIENSEEHDLLTREAVYALFSGAPRFGAQNVGGRLLPTVSYPWDSEVKHTDATDSEPPSEPSYMAATVRIPTAKSQSIQNGVGKHQIHQVDTVETPSWMSAHGVEPGSIGFTHFVELPQSDSLLTEVQYDKDSEEFLETTRNKGFMQTNPERVGIRAVDMDLVYNRLIEFQDLYEAFQQSPERVTILNNQTPGDLYGHLFGTFLTPPGYAGSDLDPVGLQVQILAILRVLNLKGIWYDFSLVEWRIRLGQILFSDPEPVPSGEQRPFRTVRDILLLQISLSCELLLRLDAVSATRAGEVNDQTQVSAREIETFASLTTRKTDWDMILARRFLENILVIKGDDESALTPVPEKRGLLSIFGGGTPKEAPRSDIIFLPQHQTRQLSGLLHFAESIKWPTTDSIWKALVEKLGVSDQNTERAVQPASPSAWSFNPTTPSVVSVYGTPLQTPRSASHQLDDYFGRVQKPTVRRNNSKSLRVPLSNKLLSLADSSKPVVVDVGGWLSRSFLTGLILPGEAISHFLISTILENDQSAISALGDSADLYGGFVYNGKSWWSKASIIGRVLACTEGAQECMGWIHVDKLPDGAHDGWHSIRSEQVPVRLRSITKQDMVATDSSALPASTNASIKSTDLIMPQELEDPSETPLRFVQWDLTPLNIDLIDGDAETDPPTESDVHTPSVTFKVSGDAKEHVLTLTHEVHFVTSWPCYTPASTSAASPRHVAKRPLAGTLSHSSSKRSISTKLSRRNSHGFEPLLSHPPEAADLGPQRSYVAAQDDEQASSTLTGPVVAHPLHASYRHKIIPVSQVLAPDFLLPFTVSASKQPTCSSSTLLRGGHEQGAGHDDHKTVLVLDARGSSDRQLLARAWCAERGLHAVIGRVDRTCVACCVREARGLGINVVIRV